LDADDEGQADQEEDLGGVSGVCVFGWIVWRTFPMASLLSRLC
jgi:hypothetical protein